MGDEANPRTDRPGYRRLVAAALLVAVALTGCTPSPAASGTDGSDALAKWQSFPVTADPRPLILTDGAVIDPANGFGADEDKLAYLAGEVEFATTAPATPATSAGYAIVSAQAALRRLRPTGDSQPAARPLRVVRASLAQKPFGTDRGPQPLPAWRVELAGVTDPVYILAVDNKHLWRSASLRRGNGDPQAILSGDGRSLTFRFLGVPPGSPPCGAEYTAEASESPTAVVVMPRIAASGRGDGGGIVCPAYVTWRTVTVQLAAPLGARVLLREGGWPVPVTSR